LKDKTSKKPILPLVRLRLIQPFLDELKRRTIDPREVLVKLSISKKDLDNPDVFIPAPKMYSLVENLSIVSGDPYFGAHIGSQLDPLSWSPLKAAAEQSATVGEFLLRFMEDANHDENSVTYSLSSVGNRSTFYERRFTDGGLKPRHNDGFTIAFLVTLIRSSVGELWDGTKVIAKVCDPSVVPDEFLGIKAAITDTFGASINFPTNWLIQSQPGRNLAGTKKHTTAVSPPSGRFVNALRVTLQPHIHEFDLGADRVATICGLSKRTLARRLQTRGTSLRKELNSLRMSRAEKTLSGTDLRISEVALMVGYANPTVFTRAFKRWTGMSPRQYRAKQKGS
jgi:AraC-like DNA-binding protein